MHTWEMRYSDKPVEVVRCSVVRLQDFRMKFEIRNDSLKSQDLPTSELQLEL